LEGFLSAEGAGESGGVSRAVDELVGVFVNEFSSMKDLGVITSMGFIVVVAVGVVTANRDV
jgi:hypothetical protein